MPGFTGDLDVDLERGLAECASKRFHGQRKMIKVHIQAVAETAQVSSKEETCWRAIAAATAWLPAPEHTMTASLAADMADAEPWPTPKQSRRGEGGVPAAIGHPCAAMLLPAKKMGLLKPYPGPRRQCPRARRATGRPARPRRQGPPPLRHHHARLTRPRSPVVPDVPAGMQWVRRPRR